jgi:hypothetical protein
MSFVRILFSAALLTLTLAASPQLCAQQKAVAESEAGQHVGEDVAITGKVVAVSKSAKGTTYLNFGDRFPRQVFSGVVLARDEAKVGDTKIYEGKVVTVTGRVELSPDQKPQILITAPTQIQLAEPGTTPAPPAPTSGTAPMAPPSTPTSALPAPAALQPQPASLKKIALAPNWNSPVQGGEMTRKDLASIFGGPSLGNESNEGDPTIVFFDDVTFLMPLGLAKKRLKLEGTTAFVSKVTCPGLPVGSFSAHGFAGVFAGGFNRLYLITDLADQVVSILLVDENSRQRSSDITDTTGYHTYNFINGRSKGNNDLVVKHQILTGAPRGVVVVESMLIDPTDEDGAAKGSSSSRSTTKGTTTSRTSRTGKVNERSRWYVPNTIVSLILRCVGNR